MRCSLILYFIFFFNDTATTEIYTLSLHDALPICSWRRTRRLPAPGSSRPTAPAGTSPGRPSPGTSRAPPPRRDCRSEEHTSELQSRQYLVCRLLLEKKKNTRDNMYS